MTIDQIQCFQMVVEVGSFTKAAEKLNRAKSAVIYSVKNLEEQLGFSLLDRSKYRPEVTPKGQDFLIRSAKIIHDMDELQQQTKLIASDIEMRIRISASGIFNSALLYPVLKQTMKKFPSTEVIFEKEILSGEKMLTRGLVDLAIFENLKNKRDFPHKLIAKVPLYLVIASDHDFFAVEDLKQTKSRLYKYPQIIQRSTIPDPDTQVGVHKDSLKWKVTDTPSKREIILGGLGWGRLPKHETSADLESRRLTHLKQFRDDDVVDIYLCSRSKERGKVAQHIWDSFEEI
ncbi:MAG: LysR family transcriptional regulator [Pseudobacteriovorax sp.]|nr:LysR family transcriptional regulator [Pseudobacteriovorax sp.]